MQLIRALQQAGKSFDVQVGPDRGHSGINHRSDDGVLHREPRNTLAVRRRTSNFQLPKGESFEIDGSASGVGELRAVGRCHQSVAARSSRDQTRQVFSEAVGVVGGGLARARDRKEAPAGFRQAPRRLTQPHDLAKLTRSKDRSPRVPVMSGAARAHHCSPGPQVHPPPATPREGAPSPPRRPRV